MIHADETDLFVYGSGLQETVLKAYSFVWNKCMVYC